MTYYGWKATAWEDGGPAIGNALEAGRQSDLSLGPGPEDARNEPENAKNPEKLVDNPTRL